LSQKAAQNVCSQYVNGYWLQKITFVYRVDKKETSMQQHQQVHEDIASDMINLTKTLKHNISSSAKIIKDDINTLKSATSNTESNLQQLKKESTRLDTHMNKSSCWLWMALIAVALTFVAVIFLIRFFPKPR